jgi:hypothetical protein
MIFTGCVVVGVEAEAIQAVEVEVLVGVVVGVFFYVVFEELAGLVGGLSLDGVHFVVWDLYYKYI